MTPWKSHQFSQVLKCQSSLQFGHGYDTVEITYLESYVSDEMGLQFGHGYDTVEIIHVQHGV